MFVKISTEAVWKGERIGAGSVIDVPAETYELNASWMTPVDDKAEKKLPPAKEQKTTES